MRKKTGLIAITLAAVLMMSACQKNPETSIVSHKDMDELIEKAQDTEEGIVDVAEVAKEYDSYKTELKDETMHVAVKVDADVDIPETDKLSVYRVRQKELDQAIVDKAVACFLADEVLYDGAVLSTKTKGDIEKEIAQAQQYITEIENDATLDEDSKKAYISDHQNEIDNLKEEYENAPAEINWDEYKTDSKLRTVKEKMDSGIGYDLYKWMYDLNSNDVVAVVTKPSSTNFSDFSNNITYLYAQNNDNYGNLIRYSKETPSIGSCWSVLGNALNIDGIGKSTGFGANTYVWPADEDVPVSTKSSYEPGTQFIDATTVSVNGSLDDAKQIADETLNRLGISDFCFYEGGKYNVLGEFNPDSDAVEYKTYHVLTYMRKMEGTFVNYDTTEKYMDGWNGDDFYKKMWNLEQIQFFINDDGIASFEYASPLEITETVVDKSAIKSFDEIKDIFEQMVLVTNALDDEYTFNKSIEIDRVVLGYARISEPDSFDTGLLVPVWDFIGTEEEKYSDGYSEGKNYKSILTINAIDGTVIDRSLGY